MITFSQRSVGDVTILDITGSITRGEGSSSFRDRIRDLVAQGKKKILLNLGDVELIDGPGIGELVSAFTTVANHHGIMKLLSLTKRVHDLLQMTKLYSVFKVYDDETAAVRSFSE